MTRIAININPELLRWAREESGYSYEEISDKLDIAIERYKDWEEHGHSIPYGKLKLIAKNFKRQIATFFLPETPPKQKLPKDYRNFEPSRSIISKDILAIIRKVNKFRQAANELKGENYWQSYYEWYDEFKLQIADNNLNSKRLDEWLRSKLEIDLNQQLKFSSPSDAYRVWRSTIEEKLGILVFQFSMPFKEVQGFCYTDYFPYAIVVNSKHTYTGRIFTLFHELGHIFKKQSGLCTPEFVEKQQKLEFECNTFAGEFLVPENSIIPTRDLEEIEKFANQLKISREVYLRRLFDTESINNTLFFSLLEEIKESYKNLPKKKSGFVMPEVKSKAERGPTFFNLVVDSLNNNQMSYSTASDLLGLNISRVLSEV